MFNNLNAEFKRSNVSLDSIAQELGVTNRTMRNKKNGITQFTRNEMYMIRDKFFPKLGVEYLFYVERDIAKEAMEFQDLPTEPKK